MQKFPVPSHPGHPIPSRGLLGREFPVPKFSGRDKIGTGQKWVRDGMGLGTGLSRACPVPDIYVIYLKKTPEQIRFTLLGLCLSRSLVPASLHKNPNSKTKTLFLSTWVHASLASWTHQNRRLSRHPSSSLTWSLPIPLSLSHPLSSSSSLALLGTCNRWPPCVSRSAAVSAALCHL